MSRYTYIALLAASLFSVNGVMADEVTRSTQVDAPGYSANTTTKSTDETPSVTRESTTTVDSTPEVREVRTSRSSKTNCPATRRSSCTHKETKVVTP